MRPGVGAHERPVALPGADGPRHEENAMRTLKPLFFFWLVLTLAGALAAAPAAFAQECPRAPGVAELPPPAVTAADVEAGRGSLRDFVLAAANATTQVGSNLDEAAYLACLTRLRGGPYFSGDTYIVTLTLDGRVFINAKDMSTGGRPLDPRIFGAILHALGIDATSPATIQAGLGNVLATGTFPNPQGGAFDASLLGVSGAAGYAFGYLSGITRTPLILLAGFDIQESHFVPEAADPGMPSITAAQVTDRATLKQFVDEAADFVKRLGESGDLSANSKIRVAFRDPNGPWRNGPTYLFTMDRTGYTLFHGAFPDRFELQIPTKTLRDERTGRLILPQIIQAATRAGEAGDYVSYYFDDPSDPNDDFNTLKVTYAREVEVRVPRPDGSVFTSVIIIGSGIYGDSSAVAEDVCPLPAGVTANPLATPSITAEQVEAGSADLSDFALAAKRYMESVERGPELAHNACVVRQEGPWKSGDTYLVTINTEGRVFFHSKSAVLGGRPLKRPVWAAIAAATGAAALRTTGAFGNPNGGALPAQIGGGYAVGFTRTGGNPLILVAGLDIGEAHLDTETIDPGDPTVRADQVVDRDTLKTFVNEATDYVLSTFRSEGRAAFNQVKSVLRDPNGPWRHGPVYLFIMEPTGYTIFHGAFPDRFEFRRPTDTLRDEVTGRLILPQIIRTATSSEDGGFVQYYFDNPDDPNDDFNTLKVTYAHQHVFSSTLADGTPFEYPLIFGAGIYGDSSAVAEDVCPRPAGVTANPLATPSITAEQVEAGSADLSDFALAAKRYMESVERGPELAHNACVVRQDGPWKSGDTYLVTINTEGRVFFHSKSAVLGGRPLKRPVWAAIAAATGAAALRTTGAFGNPNGGALPAQIGGGYAIGFQREGGSPLILVAGLDIGEAHLDTETIDPGDPTVRADEVVDRDTLKTFVKEATDYVLSTFRSEGRAAFTQVKSVLRDPNGPWRHGPVYLFIMEPTGYTIFHGAFPDRFEFRRPTDTLRDEVTGRLILPQIIRTATSSEDGGFVQYYFDNPDDPNDDFNTLKVTYARQHVFSSTLADGTTFEYPLIFGAGIYGEEGTVSERSVAATRGWLARFGRAVGSRAVEMISSRLNAPAQGGAKMTLGGQTVKLDADPERYLTREGAGFGFASLAHDGIGARGLSRPILTNRPANGEEDSPGVYSEMTMSQLLSGASFHLASAKEAAEAAGSRWSIWGRGAQSSFEGGGDAAIEGDVTTAMLGVDYEKGKLLAGVALSRASGDGGFENGGRSELEATLTSVHPYLRYEASERLSLWGVLGMGQGEMTLDESDQKHETDIEMRMGAFGVRGALTKVGGFDLAVKSDVLLTQMDSDAKDGLESISAESSRLRVMLEASRKVAMEGGGTFRPSVEAGLRHDGGDVDEGLGVEVGGRLRFTSPSMGLTFELNARGLVTHEEKDVADWGVGGMIRIAPGKEGRGLALTVRPEVGETAGGAAPPVGYQGRLASGAGGNRGPGPPRARGGGLWAGRLGRPADALRRPLGVG